MAYEVTKQIKGRHYRYRVEGYRDPQTGSRKTRWKYIGPVVAGRLTSARRHRGPVSKQAIVEAIAALLEHRDPSTITVAVIMRRVNGSPSSFYRCFKDRRSAFTAALALICDSLVDALPSLNETVTSAEQGRERLFTWMEHLYHSALRQRALRSSLALGVRGKMQGRIARSAMKIDLQRLLANYLKRLADSQIIRADDTETLASSILNIHKAFARSAAVQRDVGDEQPLEIQDAFAVIDRAVFGPHVGCAHLSRAKPQKTKQF